MIQTKFVCFCRCTPCGQRRGKVLGPFWLPVCIRMHSVRTAPWQRATCHKPQTLPADALRADSAVAKQNCNSLFNRHWRCTPCGQRRGKGFVLVGLSPPCGMHSVRTAPWQRCRLKFGPPSLARCTPCGQRRGKDSPGLPDYRKPRCTPCGQRRGKA